MTLARRRSLRVPLSAVLLTVLVATLTACEGVAAGQEAARDACAAYAKAGRPQAGATARQADDARGRAREDARRAAAANATWATLRRDIDDIYSRGSPPQTASADQSDAYVAADRRVEADCAAAGRDIGPREP